MIMALSDRRILEAMKAGDIVITPFNRKNLATSSYDVCLGELYFREQPHPKYHHNIYNIYNKRHTDHVWGTKPYKAEKASEALKKYNFSWEGINPDDKVIFLCNL
jgi:deoxycytidine triphosphate deaminase